MHELLGALLELLDSGSDEGCDGLVVVGREEFLKVRRIVKDMTGEDHGDVKED